MNVISLAGYVAWFGICLSHYRFRKAYVLQGHATTQLTFHVRWFPFAPLFAMALIAAIMIGQEVMVALNGQMSLMQFLSTYIGLMVFAALYCIYKYAKKTTVVKLQDCIL